MTAALDVPSTHGHVLIVSNIPAPYRIPVYAALRSEGVDLEVRHLADSEPARGWSNATDPTLRRLKTWGVPYGEGRLYLLRPQRRCSTTWKRTTLVISGWESPAAWQLLALARLHRTAVVGFYESTGATHRFSSGPVAALRSGFFRRVDAVLTAGPASTAAVLAMGVSADRIVTGFNSVDVQAFADGAALARDSAPASSGHRFLYVGQLIERKNVSAALQAFAQIATAEDTFTIVGTGPLRLDLQKHAVQLGISDRLHFLGHREDNGLHEAYGHADTLVLPSNQEVWGLVVNEALAAGLHTVVSSEAGVVPSIRHMTGVHTALPTADGLAHAMSTSRSTWTGPVPQPEMLQHTPDKAAEHILDAVALARRRRDASTAWPPTQ